MALEMHRSLLRSRPLLGSANVLRQSSSAPRHLSSRVPKKPDSSVTRQRSLTMGEQEDTSRFRFNAPLNARKMGKSLLEDPLWNKGTGFTRDERVRLGLRGFLPNQVSTLCDQRDNFLANMRQLDDPLQQNRMLQDLHNRNETLFHRVLLDEIEEISPLVYTPTVGLACQTFSAQYSRPRGMFFTPDDRGEMGVMMRAYPARDVSVVVVTDGSRILGLGDLGANGMGIPIGKLALYCGAGGIAPHRVLPVTLDFGTDNEQLLADPLYRGRRHKRLRGDEYFSLVDEFMQSVYARYPTALVQFEDFSSDKASTILSRYRDRFLCFNDDIQGTGATVLAGVLGALRQQSKPPEELRHLKVVVVGAGSAGIGVAQSLQQAMVQAGATDAEACSNFYIFDADGLLGGGGGSSGGGGSGGGSGRSVALTEEQAVFRRADLADGLSLDDAIGTIQPDLILGVSGRKGTISEAAIRTMASHKATPMIFPLSNPTSSAELTAAEAYEWSDGRAIVATGSPFAPVALPDGRTLAPSQCNNMYIFPGLGLGATVCQAESVPDSMLYQAAVALSQMPTDEEMAAGRVFPEITSIRDCSYHVAVAVTKHALEQNLARAGPSRGESIEQWVARKMYYPEYAPLYCE